MSSTNWTLTPRIYWAVCLGGALAVSIGLFETRVTAQSAPVRISARVSIQQMVDANPAGTTYLLEAGVHRLQTVVPKEGDVFVGEPGAVLSGAKVLSGWVRDGVDWRVDGQTQGIAPHLGAACLPAYPRCVHPEDLWMDGALKIHVQNRALLQPGAWYFDYAADAIYVRDDPTGAVVETSVAARGFMGSASRVTIRDLVVERYANVAQLGAIDASRGRNWTVERTEIRFNHGIGLRTGHGLRASNVFIHDNYQLGLGGAGRDVIVEQSQISANNLFFDAYWEGGGAKFVGAENLTVRGNWVHHNNGPGLWTDVNNRTVLYEGNVVELNERAGILHEVSFGATIRGNTLRQNGTSRPFPFWVEGAGIHVINSQDVLIEGNQLENNWQGITILHEDARESGAWTTRNIRVVSNTVAVTNPPGDGAGRTGFHDRSGRNGDRNVTFQGNTYVLPSDGRAYFFWNGEQTEALWIASGHGTNESITRP